MTYYALFYELVDDMVTKRVPYREEHLRLARESRERGELVLAGALGEPVDRALLVFRVENKSTVEDFARKDPYVIHGLATKWEVRPWNVVVGNEAQSAASRPSVGNVLRRWTARARNANLHSYVEHFSKHVLPELRLVPGYLGASLSLDRGENETGIVVETTWRSLDDIRGFAGADIETAVVAPQAAALLTSYDRRVQHSQIALSDSYPVPEINPVVLNLKQTP